MSEAPKYGKAEDLCVIVGEGEVFLDADAVMPTDGFSLTPGQAERLADELRQAAIDARSFRYGN